ncbi:MAG: septum formation initiator family protein [Sphaerobacteraceae bacterium]|nr:MAG: septum formation initiator family protein [Sphaerobacteraceae bacterium]
MTDRIYTSISEWLGPIRGRIMIGFVLIVGMYFVLSFGEQAWRAQELESDVAERKAEITELRQKRDSLEQQIQAYDSDQYETYVAQIARRDLNLAFPGETVMLVRWNEAPTPAVENEPEPEADGPPPNWQRWMDILARRS